MKKNLVSVCAVHSILFLLSVPVFSQNVPVQKTGARTAPRTATRKPAGDPTDRQPAAETSPLSDDDQLKAIVALPPADRIDKLKAFIDSHPNSPLKARAGELIVSAHAANGDEKLRTGNNAAGVSEFRAAVAAAPADMTAGLYYDVVAQIPSNLFLRGQRDAAIEMAHSIEGLANQNPNRLLALGTFYLRMEATDDAARIGDLILKVKPDSAAAYQMIGVADQMSFRLDDAIAQFSRALEIEPKSGVARSNLADLKRASGKPEEALALYREQLLLTPDSSAVQSGIILSLFDLGRKDEAETELKSALKSDPQNLTLLVGAAYWLAAHGDGARAVELAQAAVTLQPRYIWSYIALARGLAVAGKPQNSDGLITFARRFGDFPTLDYELASALSASGLYQEASESLVRSFTLKGDAIHTRLGNRVPADATNFIDLLAAERRASIFQPSAADSRANARSMKALLEFTLALNVDGLKADTPQEAAAVEAAQRFVGDKDPMRVYREIFVSERLLRRQIGHRAVAEFMADAPSGVEAGLDSPTSTMATLADQVRGLRDRAAVAAGTANIPALPRDTRSNILRGRIEDNTGLALYSQSKMPEATTHFKRAVSVLPDGTVWDRDAYWHLGDALKSAGSEKDALDNYLKGYDPTAPDAVKRAVIQVVYKRVNGSLDGLDEKIGAAPSYAATDTTAGSTAPPKPEVSVPAEKTSPPETAPVTSGAVSTSTAEPSRNSPTPDTTTTVTTSAAPPPTPAPTPVPTPASTPVPTPVPTPVTENSAPPAETRPAESVPTPTPAPETKPPAADPGSSAQPTPGNSNAADSPTPKTADTPTDNSAAGGSAPNAGDSTTRKRTVDGSSNSDSGQPATKPDQNSTDGATTGAATDSSGNAPGTEATTRKRRVTPKKH